jgi:hypothetical protein
MKRWGELALDAARANPDVTVVTPVTAMPDAAAQWLAQHPHKASEHEEQVALFEWAAREEANHPELAQLFAVPNGGKRHPAVAAQLKAEGTKAGVPDVLLDVARGKFHGLRIEMKRTDRSNGPTPEQKEWIARYRHYGYSAVVCYGAQDAINVITAYLAQDGGA